MKFLILAISLAYTISAEARIEVAVVDTGLNNSAKSIPICPLGSLDFTSEGFKEDPQSHGTNVVGLISNTTGPGDYCFIITKVFEGKSGRPRFNFKAYLEALKYLKSRKPAIINLSIASADPESREESKVFKELLDSGITIIAAAGNKKTRLSPKNCNTFPACSDSRVIVVGNVKDSASNFGPSVDAIIDGNDKTANEITMSGSSQSTAIYSGMLLKTLLKTGAQK